MISVSLQLISYYVVLIPTLFVCITHNVHCINIKQHFRDIVLVQLSNHTGDIETVCCLREN